MYSINKNIFLFVNRRVKKILADYSEIIFTMKRVDVKRTNQLAIDASNDIKEEIKQNKIKEKKKNAIESPSVFFFFFYVNPGWVEFFFLR